MMKLNVLTYILGGIVLLLITYLVGYNIGIKRGEDQLKLDYYTNSTLQNDTITVHDTIVEYKPYPKYITKTKETIDTIYEYIHNNDTVYIPINLPIINKEYSSNDYKAIIKGVEIGDLPSLEAIEIYKNTEYITTTKIMTERKRWGWQITGGLGYGFNPNSRKFEPNIGITIGFGYNLSR